MMSLVLATLLGPQLALANPPARNDNAPGPRVLVCNEALAEFAPHHVLSPDQGEPVIDGGRHDPMLTLLEQHDRAGRVRDYGLRTRLAREIATLAAQYPRIAVTTAGAIVELSEIDATTIRLRRSVGADTPFEREEFVWHDPGDAPAQMTASPTGRYLAFSDGDEVHLHIVDALTGRVLLERRSFGFEVGGVRAGFSHDGRTAWVQRAGFIEIFELGPKMELVKAHDFGGAVIKPELEGLTNLGRHAFEVDTRGNMYALRSRDRVITFFLSEPALSVSLAKRGSYPHRHFAEAPPTVYTPSPVPENLSISAEFDFRFLDRPLHRGRGWVSPNETRVAEYRGQYHGPHAQSFVDLFDVGTMGYLRTIGLPGTLTALSFSSDDRWLALATNDGKTVRVYDLHAGDARPVVRIRDLPLYNVTILGFTKTGDLLVGSTAGARLLRYALPKN